MHCDVSWLDYPMGSVYKVAMRKLKTEGVMCDGHDGKMTFLCFGDRCATSST